MGRPKSEDPGILISFRIPKSLYAWWELEADLRDLTVPQLMKGNAIEDAEQGLDQLAQFEEISKSAQSYRVGDTTPVIADPNSHVHYSKVPCGSTVPLHLTDELRMREAEASARLSEESPFKTRKPRPKQEEPVDLMTKLEESLAVAKAEKDRRKTLARKQVITNFKKDKK